MGAASLIGAATRLRSGVAERAAAPPDGDPVVTDNGDGTVTVRMIVKPR